MSHRNIIYLTKNLRKRPFQPRGYPLTVIQMVYIILAKAATVWIHGRAQGAGGYAPQLRSSADAFCQMRISTHPVDRSGCRMVVCEGKDPRTAPGLRWGCRLFSKGCKVGLQPASLADADFLRWRYRDSCSRIIPVIPECTLL